MNITLIVESIAVNKIQENLSNTSKQILTEAIIDDGQSLFSHIIYEAIDNTDNKTLKDKMVRLWETIKAYAINLTNLLLIKINDKIGVYKSIAKRFSEFYASYKLCKDVPVEGMYDYGDIFSKRPEDVIRKVITDVLSKKVDSGGGSDVSMTSKESDSIAKEVEEALNKNGLTDNTIGELKQINKIGDIRADYIMTTISRRDKIAKELKRYLTVLNDVHALISRVTGGYIPCKMNLMRIGSKYLSKYMKYSVENLMQSVKIAKICLNTYDNNNNK